MTRNAASYYSYYGNEGLHYGAFAAAFFKLQIVRGIQRAGSENELVFGAGLAKTSIRDGQS